jgi:hypothetical protein
VHLPSGTAWGITADDLQTPWQRLYQSLAAPQWQHAMFPEGPGFMVERLVEYILRFMAFEFALVSLAAAIIGLQLIRKYNRPLAHFLLAGFLTVLFLVINYEPGDKHIFYLPTYLLMAVAACAGFGRMLDAADNRWPARPAWVNYGLPLLLLLLIGQHFWPARLGALGEGKASFVTENYPYPVHDLSEPRRRGAAVAAVLPDDALVLLEWQLLYAAYYMTAVEQGRTGITMIESNPFGANGRIQPPLLLLIEEALQNGRPVYSDNRYDLDRAFRLQPDRNGLYRLALP